jgi:flagellar biosynthesis chaperone FliJ
MNRPEDALLQLLITYPRQTGILFLGAGIVGSIYSLVRNETNGLQFGLLVSLMGGLLAAAGPRVTKYLEDEKQQTEGTYAERLNTLTTRLSEASAEVDSILGQLQTEAKEKEAIVTSLEEKFTELTSRKSQLETAIEQLEQIKDASPLVDELTRNVEGKLDKDAKSARKREIVIFMLGFLIGLPFSIISDVVANLLTN